MQRRGMLTLGLVSAATLALAGSAAGLWQPGWQGGRLGHAARGVFFHAGKVLLEGSLPARPQDTVRALEAMVDRASALIGSLPSHAQAELSQLLALLSTAPGRLALAGLAEAWPEASPEAIHAALEFMRRSSLALRQQAYHALHDIVAASYFAHEGTWTRLGYPGPAAV